MVVIIKVSPPEFYNDRLNKLLKNLKIMSYFENKKTYNNGLLLILEMITGGKTSFRKD